MSTTAMDGSLAREVWVVHPGGRLWHTHNPLLPPGDGMALSLTTQPVLPQRTPRPTRFAVVLISCAAAPSGEKSLALSPQGV